MIIYREEVERVRTQNRRNVRPSNIPDPATGEKQISYSRGNTFESLAGTNPEEFDKEKLKAIKNSKNMVEEFNIYFDAVLTSSSNKLVDFASKNPDVNTGDKNALNKYYSLFNMSIFNSMSRDLQSLINEYGMSPEDATKAVYHDFVPEALSEAGVRKLIDVRLKNNQLLTDALTKMLKQNYQVLNISEAEAASLIHGLNNDSDNHKAIGKIKEFLQDPSRLNKFKMGKNNYDFRSIGGGCIFLSDTDNIKFSSHPSKNLDRIFKYDAIIIGHGAEDKDSSVHRAKDIADKDFAKKALQNSLYSLNSIVKIQSSLNRSDFSDDDFTKIETSTEELKDFIKKLEVVIKQDINYDDTDKLYKEIIRVIENNIFYDRILKDLNYSKANIKKAQNWFKSKADPKTAMKDGGSANWTVEPINTLKRSGLNTIIDIIRQLKNEGFKNIYIGSCNPGNITLPADIRKDKDFKVTCSAASVWLEDELFSTDMYESILEMEYNIDKMFDIYGRDYENYSFKELCRISDELRNELYLTEGVGDVLKSIIKKAGQIIVAIWNKVVKVLKTVVTKVYGFIRSRLDKNYKLESPVKSTIIEIKSGKPVATEVTITNTSDIEKVSKQSFDSLKDFVTKQNQKEKVWLSKIEKDIAAGKFSSKANGKVIDAKYREVKESAIFNNLQFI